MPENLTLYLSLSLTTLLTFGVASRRRHLQAKHYLFRNLPVESDVWRRAENFVKADLGMAPGIPLFDVLYSALKRDEETCNAVLKIRPDLRFENLREAISWVKEKVPALRKQTAHRFVLEEKFFEIMKGNHSKKDLHAVNGEGVLATLSKNEPAHSGSGHLSDIGDFADYVPLATLVYSVMKNSKEVLKKQKRAKTAAGHVLLDTAAPGLASFGGAKAGFMLGVTLAPFTMGLTAEIIPAAATVIGSILGTLGGKGIVKYIKDRPVRIATAALLKKSGQFYALFEAKCPELITIASRPYEERKQFTYNKARISQSWFGRIFFPTIPIKFLLLSCKRLDQEIHGVERFYKTLLSKSKHLGRNKGGVLLFSQGKTILLDDHTLLSSYEEVQTALDVVEAVRSKVS